MPYSVITSKGQTTIPKEIRDFLGVAKNDKVAYFVEPDKHCVVITGITGTILDLKGSVSHKGGPIDFKKLREKTKKSLSTKRRRNYSNEVA